MNAKQTPLVDLLKNVPKTARLVIEENDGTRFIPVGKLCADAVDEIEALRKAAALVAAAEREACAVVAEKLGVHPALNVYNGGPDWYKHGKQIAAKIRERGQE